MATAAHDELDEPDVADYYAPRNVWTDKWNHAIGIPEYCQPWWTTMPRECTESGGRIKMIFRKAGAGILHRAVMLDTDVLRKLSAGQVLQLCLLEDVQQAIRYFGVTLSQATTRPFTPLEYARINSIRAILFILIVKSNAGLALLQTICEQQFYAKTADWTQTVDDDTLHGFGRVIERLRTVRATTRTVAWHSQ